MSKISLASPRANRLSWMKPRLIAIVTMASALAVVCVPAASLPDETASYVGGAVCSTCHAAEAERWKGSHHAWAMQKATEATVLGDFANAQLEHFGGRDQLLPRRRQIHRAH